VVAAVFSEVVLHRDLFPVNKLKTKSTKTGNVNNSKTSNKGRKKINSSSYVDLINLVESSLLLWPSNLISLVNKSSTILETREDKLLEVDKELRNKIVDQLKRYVFESSSIL
jgi:hypothetical protein